MPEDVLDRLFAELAATELPVPAHASVVARGGQRRRRARVQAASAALAAAVAAAVIIVAGTSQLPVARRSTQPPASHGRPASAVCVAAPSPALNAELKQELPISSQLGVSPIAMSPDGTDIYVETSAQGFHGIAEESLASGLIHTTIYPLSAKYRGAVGGLAPDGDLVWTTTYSLTRHESPAYAPVRSWSPRTGEVTTLEPAGRHGGPLGPPVLDPGQNLAAWEQADGSQQEIVEANLATGTTSVIARGYLGPPVFVGNALAWPAASNASDQPSHLVAVNAASLPALQQIAVPQALQTANQAVLMGSGPAGFWPTPISLIASNGVATAYFSADLTKLYYSPSPSQPARLVLQLTGANNFAAQPPVLGNGYLGWSTDSAMSYLASTTSLAAATIINGTTLWGGVQGAGDYVLVEAFHPTKKVHLSNWYLVSGPTIKALKCANPAKPSSH